MPARRTSKPCFGYSAACPFRLLVRSEVPGSEAAQDVIAATADDDEVVPLTLDQPPAVLRVWQRPIAVFRAGYDGITPADRAL